MVARDGWGSADVADPGQFWDEWRKCLRAVTSTVTKRNVTTRNNTTHPLTTLQQAILHVLWTGGPATAEQIRAELGSKHPLKDSSVRTLLRRLEARGFVNHTVDGKVFVYAAKAPAQSVAAKAVRAIIDRFWSGSVEQFLTGMVDEKVLSASELQRLAKKVKGAK